MSNKSQQEFVLVADDGDWHPEFLSKYSNLVVSQPFLSRATVFPTKESAKNELNDLINSGGRNVPPFRVATRAEAEALPNRLSENKLKKQ